MMAAEALDQGHTLSALLAGLVDVPAQSERQIRGIALDSRELQPGGLFLACQGVAQHGLDFVQQALKQGPAAIAWEPDGASIDAQATHLAGELDLPLLRVENLSRKASLIAARYYDFPSRHMLMVGITGTNGKTSVSHLLAQALHATRSCGIVGTLGVGYVESLTATGYTTPDAVTLQKLLAELHADGAQAVAMEVSSHALDQDRAAAVHFDVAVFTNISRDHFDYHASMESYAAAKRRLFHMPHLRTAVINLDDSMGAGMLGTLAHGLNTLVYSLDARAVIPAGVAGWVKADSVAATARGLEIRLNSHWGEGVLHSSLLGRFNAANLLAVLLVLMDQGWCLTDALQKLAGLTTVAGRMQAYGTEDQPTVVIDYAHTPDALEKALLALRSHCSGQLRVVFGCGGDRDRGKRPLMGAAAERLADQVILTDDNPRTEPGDRIIQEILTGISRTSQVLVERNRAAAIHLAINAAVPGDLVLVAGKGHEDYQLVGQTKLPFDDQDQVLSALSTWPEENG